MRIIGGKYKGLKLIPPVGSKIRPTSDSFKESIFSIITSNKYMINIESCNVLDICSGTGSLGIEAFSRGAVKVYLIDKDQKSINLIYKNIAKLNVDGQIQKNIKIIKDDIYLGDIGATIQNHVEAQGYSVVQDFCGHGIGQQFHKEPSVLHYGKHGTGEKIKAGMIFTVEPMINLGKYETKTLNDGWTAVTKDKSLSAQFEHTIGVTKDGYEIFTLSKN